MTSSADALLLLAAVYAVGDWIAVVTRRPRLEYACKPLTMVFLLGVAAAIDVGDTSVQRWFLLALALSLLGDVFLMLPSDLFVPGLLAFLAAHLAYIVGMWAGGVSFLGFVIGLAVAGLAVVVVGARILRAVRAGEHQAMAMPVAAYMTVISLMLASAIGTEVALAVAGAALFYASDAMIAWQRFVQPRPWRPLAIMVTYHLGQAGLALSLVGLA